MSDYEFESDRVWDDYDAGRRKMVDAFVEMKAWAQAQGMPFETYWPIVGKFFDGNVEVKDAWLRMVEL